MTTVRFLGYNRNQTGLIARLEGQGFAVQQVSESVDTLGDADLVISFGYRHILPRTVLETAARPVLNLHIGYLPYNRGAHPNFWSHYENTPGGVTIHEVDEGVDTGPICYQRLVNFAPEETTFARTHARLLREVEALFVEHMGALIGGTYRPRPQRGAGTVHRARDLPESMNDWDEEIEAALVRLDRNSRIRRDLGLVDEIEQVRSRNNVNWMDLLRIAIRASPADTKRVLRRINSDDNAISELFRQLGEDDA